MIENDNKSDDSKQPTGILRSRTRQVALGFISILGLIIYVMIIWANNASSHTNSLKTLAERQTQTRLLANMLYAAQQRSLHLHQMLDTTDPFELDDKFMQFSQKGAMYIENRERLLDTQLSKEEAEILKEVDKLAGFGSSSKKNVVDLIKQGQTSAARKLLYDDVIPNQSSLTLKLRNIFESQRNTTDETLRNATEKHNTSSWMISFLGSVALLLGVFTIFVVKRTARSESQLQGQAKWTRALYDISSMSGLSPDEQITETLKLGCQLLDLEIGKVCQIDDTRQINNFLNVVAPKESNISVGMEIPLPKTFCSIAIESDQPVAIPDVKNSNYAEYPCYEFSYIECYIAAPLFVNGVKFGTVNFSSTTPRDGFSDDDIELVKLITNWVGVTIERKIAHKISVAKETAEAANETKSNFLANMSHELRTPLNAMLGYNEMLIEEVVTDDNTHYLSDLKKIKIAGQHLLSLIDDILDLSKIEAGKMEINLEHFALKPLIEEVYNTVLPMIDKNNNTFLLDYDDNISIIKADLTKIRQILFNLLSNAGKFTDDGLIKLSVMAEKLDAENWIMFSVRDTGIGMSREQLNKLFISFSQAEEATQRKYGGTGLGLSITYRLCQLLGGSINVDSVPGVGTTFTVRIPAVVSSHSSLDSDPQAVAG
ncbi:ATP-binding protein [Kaarinaea lacus]